MRGEIDTLIGFNSEYRPPDSPDIVLDTERYSADELVSRTLAAVFPQHTARAASCDDRVMEPCSTE
jgi:adenylylsulfate kinase-like enzyme